MKDINKHGLKRKIPSDIKRDVRKKCGFGCVVCGSWICEYDHFNPEYKDSKSHNSNGIALLCGTHHEAKTKGLLTNDQVQSYRKNPYNIIHGIKNNELFFPSLPTVYLCGNEIIDGGSIIANLKFTSPFQVTNQKTNETKSSKELHIPIIKIGKPMPGEPIPIYLAFYDSERNIDPILKIENNEWYGNINNFDVESLGTKLIIRKKLGKILIRIDFNTDENRIDINNIDVTLPGTRIKRFYNTSQKIYGVDLNGIKILRSTIKGKLILSTTLQNKPGQFQIVI